MKPGGRLVYATCSLLPEENDAIVDAFPRSQHPRSAKATPRPSSRVRPSRSTPEPRLRVAPDTHGCDGFFAAVLERA